jgi:hypothetical protein
MFFKPKSKLLEEMAVMTQIRLLELDMCVRQLAVTAMKYLRELTCKEKRFILEILVQDGVDHLLWVSDKVLDGSVGCAW